MLKDKINPPGPATPGRMGLPRPPSVTLPLKAQWPHARDAHYIRPRKSSCDSSEFGLLIGPAGEMSDVIARAIAAGIALGRKEALAGKRRSGKNKSGG